ncbi:hypothetical protein [Actinoplanes sp. URMC 104]|uniref:hypothetical protein n=1 Tax=Actinoplanes sp. URMC 104 TaxID=3423409 RepID=UPI003F1A012B
MTIMICRPRLAEAAASCVVRSPSATTCCARSLVAVAASPKASSDVPDASASAALMEAGVPAR